jgi:protein-tyrosine phosphatase
VMARPHGGDWLPDVVQAWRDAHVDVMVSLLTHAEQEALELVDDASLCQRCDLIYVFHIYVFHIYVFYPIPDRGVPPNFSDAQSVIDALARHLTEGRYVAIHCRMGIGRSAMIAAATLARLGDASERACARIRDARRCKVPDTFEQRAWVERFSVLVRASNQE